MRLRSVTKVNGETAWCGPAIVSSITGCPIAHIVRVIKDQRIERGYGTFTRFNWDTEVETTVTRRVQGTHASEINRCLKHYGYRIVPTQDNLPRRFNGNNPTIARWIKQRTDRNELNLVSAGHHWQLIKGIKYVDSFTGHPVFIRKAPHRRARVIGVWRVERFGKQRIYRG